LRHRVLVVDDEPDILDALQLTFEADYDVLLARGGSEGLELLAQIDVSVIVADQRMPEMTGAEFLARAAEIAPKSVRIMLTGYTDMEALITAVNSGHIYHYIAKPWEPEDLRLEVRRAVESFEMSAELDRRYDEITRLNQDLDEARKRLERENVQLRHFAQDRYRFEGLIGQSQAMLHVYDLVEKVLDSSVSVMLSGETGTGKELLARCIHFEGSRKDGPFVAQNCGALPPELLESELFGHRKGAFTGAVEDRPGLFETADGGSVFLDEISETSPRMQVRLLRVLQEGEIRRVGETEDREVDVRVIAATNSDLRAQVDAGGFREDLYFRLNVFPIVVPPLRERVGDVPLLAAHFLSVHAPDRAVGFTPEAMDLLCRYGWRGNVRELENEVQRALLIANGSDRVGPDALSESVRDAGASGANALQPGQTLRSAVSQLEHGMIRDALERTGGNKTHAARNLGISRWGLLKKMQRHGIETP